MWRSRHIVRSCPRHHLSRRWTHWRWSRSHVRWWAHWWWTWHCMLCWNCWWFGHAVHPLLHVLSLKPSLRWRFPSRLNHPVLKRNPWVSLLLCAFPGQPVLQHSHHISLERKRMRHPRNHWPAKHQAHLREVHLHLQAIEHAISVGLHGSNPTGLIPLDPTSIRQRDCLALHQRCHHLLYMLRWRC